MQWLFSRCYFSSLSHDVAKNENMPPWYIEDLNLTVVALCTHKVNVNIKKKLKSILDVYTLINEVQTIFKKNE